MRMKVNLVVLDQGIDPTTIHGKLQFNILAAIGEFQRGLKRERLREGREKNTSEDKFGAWPKLLLMKSSFLCTRSSRDYTLLCCFRP